MLNHLGQRTNIRKTSELPFDGVISWMAAAYLFKGGVFCACNSCCKLWYVNKKCLSKQLKNVWMTYAMTNLFDVDCEVLGGIWLANGFESELICDLLKNNRIAISDGFETLLKISNFVLLTWEVERCDVMSRIISQNGVMCGNINDISNKMCVFGVQLSKILNARKLDSSITLIILMLLHNSLRIMPNLHSTILKN